MLVAREEEQLVLHDRARRGSRPAASGEQGRPPRRGTPGCRSRRSCPRKVRRPGRRRGRSRRRGREASLRAAARDGVDDPPGGGAELGGVGVRHDLELLDPVLHEGRGLLAVVLPLGGGPVHEEPVHEAALAVDRQAVAVAPRARSVTPGDSLARDAKSRSMTGRSSIWSLLMMVPTVLRVVSRSGASSGDRDLLGDPPDLQREVHRALLAHAQHEARALAGGEAGEGRGQLVAARGKVGEEVLAQATGGPRAGDAVAGLRAVTVTPGSAPPCSSVTLPRRVVVTFWATAGRAKGQARPITARIRRWGRGGKRDADRMTDLLRRDESARSLHQLLRGVKARHRSLRGPGPGGAGGGGCGDEGPLSARRGRGPAPGRDGRSVTVAAAEERFGRPPQLEASPDGRSRVTGIERRRARGHLHREAAGTGGKRRAPRARKGPEVLGQLGASLRGAHHLPRVETPAHLESVGGQAVVDPAHGPVEVAHVGGGAGAQAVQVQGGVLDQQRVVGPGHEADAVVQAVAPLEELQAHRQPPALRFGHHRQHVRVEAGLPQAQAGQAAHESQHLFSFEGSRHHAAHVGGGDEIGDGRQVAVGPAPGPARDLLGLAVFGRRTQGSNDDPSRHQPVVRGHHLGSLGRRIRRPRPFSSSPRPGSYQRSPCRYSRSDWRRWCEGAAGSELRASEDEGVQERDGGDVGAGEVRARDGSEKGGVAGPGQGGGVGVGDGEGGHAASVGQLGGLHGGAQAAAEADRHQQVLGGRGAASCGAGGRRCPPGPRRRSRGGAGHRPRNQAREAARSAPTTRMRRARWIRRAAASTRRGSVALSRRFEAPEVALEAVADVVAGAALLGDRGLEDAEGSQAGHEVGAQVRREVVVLLVAQGLDGAHDGGGVHLVAPSEGPRGEEVGLVRVLEGGRSRRRRFSESAPRKRARRSSMAVREVGMRVSRSYGRAQAVSRSTASVRLSTKADVHLEAQTGEAGTATVPSDATSTCGTMISRSK